MKEEIRKFDRMDKRQHTNMEYLKNIVIKFAAAPGQSLVPVLQQVLHLDTNETKQLRDAIAKREGSFFGFG